METTSPSSSTMATADSTAKTGIDEPGTVTNTAQTQAAMQAMMVQLTTDGVPKLHCPICNKALISLNGYVKHLKKHEPPGGFFCRYCDDRFCSDEALKKHRDAVHTTIGCRICKEITFTSEEDYREHIRVVHDGIDREIFKCEKCGAEYKTLEPFKRHQENQCGTIKPHKCDECDMAFYTKYNLKQHKITHSGERRFCCSYCGKNFLQKGRLVEHERSHTGEKPYKCDICGKCFAHRESIVTHNSIHTGIKLVECPCCLSRFSCYSNLLKHRRSRPDTCGLPEYNPPKNRIRTRKPRIPPTINPTSEIKVSNLNKIIKPADKVHEKKGRRRNTNAIDIDEKEKKPKGKRGPKRKKRKQVETETESETSTEEDDSVYENDKEEILRNIPKCSADDVSLKIDENTDTTMDKINIKSDSALVSAVNVPPAPLLVDDTKAFVVPLKTESKKNWSEDSDSAEDYPDFDPPDSDSDDNSNNGKEFELPSPKLNIKKENIDDGSVNEFEYSNANEFLEAEMSVKNEDDQNIFNEKDKLLHCILNDEENSIEFSINKKTFKDNASKLPSFDIVKVESLLDESEVVYVKDEEQMEDMLNVQEISNEISNSKPSLEKIKETNSDFKEDNSIRTTRKAKGVKRVEQKQESSDEEMEFESELEELKRKKRGKYRKRGENQNAKETIKRPRRMAKFSQVEVKERLKLMKKEKSWQCPHCVKLYHIRKPFEKHLRNEHKLEDAELKKILKDEEDVGVVDEDIFKCHICKKIYLMEKRLIAHIKLHGEDGSLTHKCPCYCSIYFATKEEAQEHARKMHKDLIYCEACDKYMTGHDALKNHKHHHVDGNTIPLNRNSQRNLVCDKCGKKYASRTSLTDHVRSDCGRIPIYPCNICGKRLTTAGILKTHLLLHKDDTPFQCDQCGKTFKVKAQYKTHIKTRHTENKPFKCHLCPKEYPYRESLLTHMTVHTGIKRFLCNGCGKRFTCISNLQAHRKVHADTCGVLPLNARATQYMGVQKGNLLMGAKPEAGLDYKETNTLIAKEVIDRDLPMAQELNYPSEPSAPMVTQPLNYAQPPTHLLLPHLIMPQYSEDSLSSY